jgi:hypothetical protein
MKGSPQAAPEFNWLELAKFFCTFHRVSDVCHIHLYGVGAVEGWTLSKPNTIGVEYKISGQFNMEKPAEEQVVKMLLPQAKHLYKSAQPKELFVNPITKQSMESDLENVSFFQVACRAYSSTLPIPVVVRMNWEHTSQSSLEGTSVADDIFAAGGAVRGGFVLLEPTEDGKEEPLQSLPMPELDHGYQNSVFAQTFAYINETNMRNGIVEIPTEVCRAANLPVWNGVPAPSEEFILQQFQSLKIEDPASEKAQNVREEVVQQYGEQYMDQFTEENSKKITHYYALPVNHVLAWGYSSDDYRSERGHRVYRFTYRGKKDSDPTVLYYLVPNPLMEHLLEEATDVWLNKVDRRPLDSVGMEFIPHVTPKYEKVTSKTGTVSLRTYYSYVSGPALQQETINKLAPTMSPDFFPCQFWNRQDMARKAALEAFERQNK